MEAHVLVHKANQIALFFAPYPREEAIAGVADHIVKFMEPRIRAQLKNCVERGEPDLHELVVAAVRRLG